MKERKELLSKSRNFQKVLNGVKTQGCCFDFAYSSQEAEDNNQKRFLHSIYKLNTKMWFFIYGFKHMGY